MSTLEEDQFDQKLIRALAKCQVNRRMESPFFVSWVSRNGSFSIAEVECDLEPKLDWYGCTKTSVLASRGAGTPALPVNVMVVDATGIAVLFAIGDGKEAEFLA